MKFTNINDLVRDICIVNLNVSVESNYLRVARAVASAVDQVGLSVMPVVKSEVVTVNSNLIAYLPPDVVTVLKVGMITSNGKMLILVKDPFLRREVYNEMTEDVPEYCDCEQPPSGVTEVPANTQIQNVFLNSFWNGQFYGELYAANNAMDDAGGWRFNRSSNILEMASGTLVEAGVKVLVEYKGMGDDSAYQLIPLPAKQCVVFYALYNLFSTSDPSRAAFFMQEFKRHLSQMKRDLEPFDPIAFSNALMRGQKSTIK